ncbi:hypothetical protein BBB03_00585 [Candidatus Portiera aleyrodidarum]|nr:hypothetical protein BBB03_00585 [Candidatus Portiera aleyrodidarum]
MLGYAKPLQKGGSIKIISKELEATLFMCFIELVFIILTDLQNLSFFLLRYKFLTKDLLVSRNNTDFAPLDIASKPSEPLPAYKSKIVLFVISFFIKSKKISRTLINVGLTHLPP